MATGVQKTAWQGNIIIAETSDNFASVGLEANLAYAGKWSKRDVLSGPPAHVEEIWRGTSSDNRLYFGDNFAILATLLSDPTVRGHVKLVYIDPPFATNKVYQSRTQADAYSDTLMGAHYVEFLRRRLILLHELLAADGSIYVHLDQTMVFHIKLIMDEVFGSDNFRGMITRKKCNPKNYTRKTYGNISDHILYYSKSEQAIWNRAYTPWGEDRVIEEYAYVEEGTGRRFKKVPVHAPGTRNGATGKPWRGMLPPPGKHWQYPPEKLDELDARGEIYWSPTGNPRRKVYLDQSEGVPVQDIWLDVKDAHNQMIEITGYPTEKNPEALMRIIQASSNAGDLVLDCFAGSGTTLAIASRLNRRWIGIDNSSESIVTILKRFNSGLERMGDFVTSKKEGMVLPLFDLADSPPIPGSVPAQSVPEIEDFVLYSESGYTEGLRQILKEVAVIR